MTTPLLAEISPEEWNERRARHLLNRAGFGVPKERIRDLVKLGPMAAVDSLVNFDTIPDPNQGPDSVLPTIYGKDLRGAMSGMSEDERRQLNNEMQKDEREAIDGLKAWWLQRMLTSPRPLEEKLTLFWHGHFATSSQKVKASYHTYNLNCILRQNAVGNFKTLTTEVGQSPAMLHYLDNRQSTKEHPNENWARELMELFTIGKGHYTEDDIKNSARAFTGWAVNDDRFAYQMRKHDAGRKVFMGREGPFDGWQIIDIIFEQPAVAERIAHKLWVYFAYETPEDEVVQELAATFRDTKYELKPMLTRIFRSKAFYSEKAIGSQIKSPAQFVVQLCSDLNISEPPYGAMARATRELGQDLFYPPNVKGWDGNRTWINASTLFARYNLPKALIGARVAQQNMTMKAENPAPDSMMAAAENGRDTVFTPEMKATLATLPPKRRKELRAQWRAAAPEEKARMAKQLRRQTKALTAWSAQPIFNAHTFATAGECIDALAKTFLMHSLDTQQRNVLLEALGVAGEPDAPITAASLSPDQMNATLHLLFSTAEYQTC